MSKKLIKLLCIVTLLSCMFLTGCLDAGEAQQVITSPEDYNNMESTLAVGETYKVKDVREVTYDQLNGANRCKIEVHLILEDKTGERYIVVATSTFLYEPNFTYLQKEFMKFAPDDIVVYNNGALRFVDNLNKTTNQIEQHTKSSSMEVQ